jgi:hypothetical protein
VEQRLTVLKGGPDASKGTRTGADPEQALAGRSSCCQRQTGRAGRQGDWRQRPRPFGFPEGRSYYKWRAEYGGLNPDAIGARTLKLLKQGNGRLKRAVANLTLDNLILKEAAEGSF